MSSVASALCLAVLGCASRATAAEVLSCPATVEVEQRHAGAAAEGWEPSREPVRHPLMGVTFFDGPPSERASLAPDADEAKGKEHVLRFELGAPGPGGHWVSCVYDRTDVVLSRQLDPRVRACSVTVDPTVTVGGRPSVLRIACR